MAGAAGLVLMTLVFGPPCSGWSFFPNWEEGNLWIRATLASDDLAAGGQRLCQRDTQDDPQLSRSGNRWCHSMAVRMTAPTAAGFFQCGILCAAEAGQRMARYS